MLSNHFKSRVLSGVFLLLAASVAGAQNSPTPVSFSGAALTQNFDTLSSVTPSPNTNTSLPPGFGFVESTTDTANNSTYVAGNGADNQGNTYSFGATGSSERALGGLQSGSNNPTFGVLIRNNSGATLTQFTVAYQGEQYRLGASRTAGVADRLDFQYSTTATTLSAAMGYLDGDALDFTSPITTGTAGPVSASAPLSATITGISLAPGATLALRWSDFNVSGADDGLAIDDFSFSVAGVVPTPPPGNSTSVLISEYRLSGPGGATDEFIELYNLTDSSLDVSRWSVVAGGVTAAIPTGTVPIPARGHLLLAGSDYSLDDYGGTGQALGDVNYTGNIPDGSTLTLRNAAGDAIDTVSASGLPALAPNSQASYVRREETGVSKDSGVDAADFNIVEVNSTTAGPDNRLGESSGMLRLGAPGPQNLGSPVRKVLMIGLANPNQPANSGDNAVYSGRRETYRLSLRRTLTNTTGSTLTRMKLHVVALTAGTPVGANAPTIADVRLMDGPAALRVNGIDVSALKLETVPGQNSDSGGGLNATLLVTLPAGGLAPNATVGFEILLRIVKSGGYRFVASVEVASDPPAPNLPDDDNLLLGNPSGAALLDSTQSNKENLLVEHPAFSLGYQQSLGGPRWVSWHLDSGDLGSTGRSDNFRPDPKLPADCRITDDDYSGSGFTRGHQCPSGDRTASSALNSDTFYMSNMLPQTAKLNNEILNNFENYVRGQLNGSANEIYTLSGGVGSNGRIAGGKVNVPASCWKVVVILPKGSNDLGRINGQTRVLSILVPNTATVSGGYADYYTSVDNIESVTGLDLLSNLADGVENVLEARVSN